MFVAIILMGLDIWAAPDILQSVLMPFVVNKEVYFNSELTTLDSSKESYRVTQNMTGNWEWVADLYATNGQLVGHPGCDSFSNTTVGSYYGSRCCFR